MNTIIILIILALCLYLSINSKETLQNEIDSYYIDSTGTKYEIKQLPLKVNNITELKYVSKTRPNVQFKTTKGFYNIISSRNELTSINGYQQTYQLLHIQNKHTPFSGILF